MSQHQGETRPGVAPAEARRARLRAVIREKSLLKGEFRLASGRQSGLFFDIKKTIADPEGANLLAEALLELLRSDPPDFIGGLEMGAIPIVEAVCLKSYPDMPIPAFFVRKEAKGHGTNKLIDGLLEDGARVVVLEDVTTTGGSALKAVEAVRARGCKVGKVLTVVDRLEGAAETLRGHGLDLVALFTRDDFAD